jgi:hypothetical protein
LRAEWPEVKANLLFKLNSSSWSPDRRLMQLNCKEDNRRKGSI